METGASQSLKSRRVSPLLQVFCIILAIATMCALPTTILGSEGDIKIGVLTSSKMECGTSTVNAAEMAAKEINSQGGVLGRKIKIVSGDTESNPEKGIMAMKRLAEKDKVDILLGGASSGVVLGLMDHLKQYNKIFLTTGASSPLIAKKVAENYEKYKYEFRPMCNAMEVLKVLLSSELAMMSELGYKKFAILREDAAWNRGLKKFLQGNISKIGGTIVATVDFDPKTMDFAPIFSKISASKADVAITIVAHTDTVTMFKQYHEMKPPFRMVGINNPGMNANYWKRTGGACLSDVTISWGVTARAKITDKSIPFYDKYAKEFGTFPHSCASTSYDAVYIFADAAERAKSLETDALIKALEATDYVGTAGRFVFNKKTHDAIFGPAEYCPLLVTQWQKGGKFEVLRPKELATAEYQNPPWLKK